MSDENPSPYAAASPPAGWYDDPEVPGQPRWWDGVQWHASQAPAQPSLSSGFSVLATSLWILLTINALLNLPVLVIYVWGVGHEPYAGASMTVTPGWYDAVEIVAGLATTPIYIATIVVWCLWQVRLARSADPLALRRSPGWHIGSWFIPFASLVMPVQNMGDLGRAYSVRWSGLLGWWWALWIANNLVGNAVIRMAFSADATFATYNAVNVVSTALSVVSATLAVLVVRKLTTAALALTSAPKTR